jgi:hypothetical protein
MVASRTSRGVRVVSFTIAFLCGFAASIGHAQTTVAGLTPGSFRVNESGAASYTIPIQVPPGIAGVEPKLAFAYNSQAGNGLLGVGWSLDGLSAIHRCGRTIVQDGLNVGVSYDANDRYCLDGQRLVAISGTYGADGTEYRTERESFTKVISYGVAGNGPAWFKVWTKSGQIMEYGNTDAPLNDSRIQAQGKTSVRTYAINKISDIKGNYVTFTYTEDNPNGDFFPTRIDYTGNTSAPFASVRFSYESRTDVIPVYVGGSVLKTQNRLINVKTYVGTNVVRDYRLAYTYAPDNGPSLLTSVKECSGDGTACLPLRLPDWQTGTGTNNLAAPVSWGLSLPLPSGPSPVLLGDINGDGFADLLYAGGVNLYARFSNGSGFGGTVAIGTAWYDSENTTYAPLAVGDVNGDGRADVVAVFGEALVQVAQTRTPDLMKAIRNSLGASTAITYKPLTDSTVYSKATDAVWPVRDLKTDMRVVSGTSASNGIGGIYNTSYFYTGAKGHMTGGGFLGFKSVASTVTPEPGETLTTTTNFRQDYPFQGLTASVEKTQSGSAIPLSKVSNSWTTTLLANPNNTGGYHRVEPDQTIEESNDLNGAPFPTVTTTYSNPDSHGNVQDILVSTPDGYSKASHNVFTNNTANWFLGRLIRSQVTSTIPASALPPSP